MLPVVLPFLLLGLAACSGSGGEEPDGAAANPTPTTTVVEVPITGTPGLDSGDAFCAAWSRWAGSLQVIAVASAFGTGTADTVAELEVAASPVVLAGYTGMLEHWPAELAAERDAAADDLFGPFTRRSEAAYDALVAAGADDPAVAAVADAWVATLAARDPTTADVTVDMLDELHDLVAAAASEFAVVRVPFADDPSLQTAPATPATLDHLETACPDDGALAGLEVD